MGVGASLGDLFKRGGPARVYQLSLGGSVRGGGPRNGNPYLLAGRDPGKIPQGPT